VEIKSVETITNAHKKQLQTYLKLTGLKLGYLLNFNEATLKDGIVRTVNGLVEEPPDSPMSLAPERIVPQRRSGAEKKEQPGKGRGYKDSPT